VTLKGQVEVVPKKLHKGVVVKRLLREVSIRDGRFPDFIMCIGDDKSDEAMFTEVFSFLGDQGDPSASASTSASALVPISGEGGGEGEGEIAAGELPAFDPSQKQYAFTITVGKKSKSIASQFVHDCASVQSLCCELAGVDEGGVAGGQTQRVVGSVAAFDV
jgi:trehalose 6-phosphate synthase/phosphatase